MNMVGSLDLPSSGKILLDGRDIRNITKIGESDLAQLRGKTIGFVFQQFNLIPSLTSIENVALPLVFQGFGEEERLQKASCIAQTSSCVALRIRNKKQKQKKFKL